VVEEEEEEEGKEGGQVLLVPSYGNGTRWIGSICNFVISP